MKLKQFFAAATLAVSSVCAMAIPSAPTYTGDHDADFGVNPGSPSSNDAGYYIWSSNGATDWSVRWTGNDNGNVGKYDWFGSVLLYNYETDSLEKVQFESGHSDDAVHIDIPFSGLDLIAFEGQAGSAYDGFDFSIVDPQKYDVINFFLGSTLFTLDPSAEPQEGQNIYIGQDFNTPDVQVQEDADGRLVHHFQVQVPEPGTLALLGLGLAGLGLARRKQAKA